jgi:rRNA-processing protein FCF1
MEDNFIYVFIPSCIMSELRKLTEESWNDILTIQIEIGRRVLNLGSKESEQTLNHFFNYL